MTTLTKATTVTYKDPVTLAPQDWLNLIFAKADEMKQDGKTDALFDFVDGYSSKRYWIDQNASDEWVAFINGNANAYNVVIQNISVEDISIVV